MTIVRPRTILGHGRLGIFAVLLTVVGIASRAAEEPLRVVATDDAGKLVYRRDDRGNRIPDFSSKIVLQNVSIIARAAALYTIRTDAQTAEKISYLNSAGGTMQFLLRAAQDQRQASTAGATFGDIFKFGIKVPTKTAP